MVWEYCCPMARGGKMVRGFQVCILAAATALPVAAFAEEPASPAEQPDEFYSSLEDLALRRTISDFSGSGGSEQSGDQDGSLVGSTYGGLDGGSAGGYVNIGGPATSTFMAPPAPAEDKGLFRSIEFGLDWRPDVNTAEAKDHRTIGRSLAGRGLDRIGVRADVTALLRDEDKPESGGSAWRVSGMLGSTSLSLLREPGGPAAEIDDSASHMLWDVGVGWSRGGVSVNAGYQSTFSLNESGDDLASVGVLSLGADYSVVPGLSVFGELNMIDSPLESSEVGFGTVVIVGTGVSF